METYEEKYKKTLEWMREVYPTLQGAAKEDAECYFPELKESEGEMICRKLIAFLKQCKGVYGDSFKQFGLDIDDAIAWLEKKGEQKHQYNSRPKYIGEEELLGEQKPTEEYNITSLGSKNAQGKLGEMIKKLKPVNEVLEQKPWSEEDESMLNFVRVVLNKHKDDAFFDKFKTTLNDCLTWFRNIKSRVCCEVNCTTTKEWSEEDEKMLDGIIEASTHHCYLNITDINWLKSLKERYTWKPSDEQIKALNEVVNYAANHENMHWNDYIFGTLNGLVKQLKNLTE